MAQRSQARPFVKMYATGNDFVIFDMRGWTLQHPGRTARQLCNRSTGIGADQLLLISTTRRKDGDFKMQAFNADGSEAEMCGNGIRCVAKYLFDRKDVKKKSVSIETLGGFYSVTPTGKQYRVNMGVPKLKGKEIGVSLNGRIINRPLRMEGRELRITCCGVGNPHCVIFVENPQDFPVTKFGPLVETYHAFPRRINVEFARTVSPNEIEMRVWERGTGETRGCGTGACAVAIAAVLNGHAERDVEVKMPGGTVKVNWDRETHEVHLTGPAELVFAGSVTVQ